MSENVNEGSSSNDIIGKHPLKGKKMAYIFTWDSSFNWSVDKNQKSVDTIVELLTNMGFVFDEEFYDRDRSPSNSTSSSDCESDEKCCTQYSRGYRCHSKSCPQCGDRVLAMRNMNALNLYLLASSLDSKLAEASCVFMYFIIQQCPFTLTEYYDRYSGVFSIWKRLKKVNCPKLFFIQSNIVDGGGQVKSALMNSEYEYRDSAVPLSANVLMAYLPSFGDSSISIADILKEELSKPYDINTVLCTVMERVNVKDRKPNPRFSSTLLKRLYLKDEMSNPTEVHMPMYNITDRKKCLAYAFLFGQFEHVSSLMPLVKMDSAQMTNTFKNLDFDYEFCVKDGHMTVREFLEKLEEIVQDKDKMERCECIMIFISSHGENNGVIYASNGLISRDMVLTVIAGCKELEGKPKLVFIDACRGSELEETWGSRYLPERSTRRERAPGFKFSSYLTHPFYEGDLYTLCWYREPEMCDVLLVLSSTEGKVSIYRTDQGSHFFSNWCKMLEKYGKEHHIFNVLTLTMSTVAHIPGMYHEMDVRQQITFTSTLRKLVKFPK